MLRRVFILLTVCALAVAGCTAPDNPVEPGNQGNQENQENQGNQGGQGTTPVNPEKSVFVTFTLSLNKTESSQEYAFPATKADEVKLRFILRGYRADASGWASSPEVDKVIYLDSPRIEDCKERIEFKQDIYKVLIWADYVKDVVNWFWNPADLSKVDYAAASYQGSSEYKQCYYSTLDLDLRQVNGDQDKPIVLDPAGSCYHIVATDASSFEGKDITAVISYLDSIPLSFDVGHGSPMGGQAGLSFSSPVKKLDNGTISIAEDYILLDRDTSIGATLTLQEKDGSVLLKQDIAIPMQRRINTLLKGEMLSAGDNAGITLDPSFDGEYESTF